jgi:hypothetical protein
MQRRRVSTSSASRGWLLQRTCRSPAPAGSPHPQSGVLPGTRRRHRRQWCAGPARRAHPEDVVVARVATGKPAAPGRSNGGSAARRTPRWHQEVPGAPPESAAAAPAGDLSGTRTSRCPECPARWRSLPGQRSTSARSRRRGFRASSQARTTRAGDVRRRAAIAASPNALGPMPHGARQRPNGLSGRRPALVRDPFDAAEMADGSSRSTGIRCVGAGPRGGVLVRARRCARGDRGRARAGPRHHRPPPRPGPLARRDVREIHHRVKNNADGRRCCGTGTGVPEPAGRSRGACGG